MNLTAEQVKNLNILADFMDGLNDPLFTMSVMRHDCNTPACAFGWACMIPEFTKQGLNLADTGKSWERCPDLFGMDGCGQGVYKELFHSGLVEKIKTPQQWAAHCRAFLKSNGYATVDPFKTFMDRVMVPVDTSEISVAVKSK